MSPFSRLLAPAVLAALAAACGTQDAPPAVQGVIHLDPRLPDGSSPTMHLSRAETPLAAWSFTSDTVWPDAWRVVPSRLIGDGPHGGALLAADPGASAAAHLVFQGELNPARVNTIEVDFAVPVSGRATVSWSTKGARRGGFVEVLTQPTEDIQTARFSLIDAPGWGGELESLDLRMSAGRAQPWELKGVRFLHEPFAWGASPIDREGVKSGDGGLIERGGVAVRAWPAAVGQPLTTRFTVPPGGRLSVQVARSSTSSPGPLEARVAVEGQGAPAPAVVALAPSNADWTPLLLDLAELAGEEVEVSFSALGEAPGEPRADVLFGSPLVLGTLPEDRRPNILLVTMDTTRFDAMGSSAAAAQASGETEFRSDRVRTPALDRFAATSFVFDNAWSAGNSTQPSHASILTGVSIQNHSLTDNFGMLADGNVTLAERLRDAGYQTAAVTCLRAISPAAGFGQGFDLFVPAEAVSGADGRLAVDDAIEWLEAWAQEGERPFFLWVHVFDPHTPYELPGNYLETYSQAVGGAPPRQVSPATLPRGQTLPPELEFLGDTSSRDYVNFLYHAEVAYTDKLMDDLLSAVEAAGVADHTLSVITADHGEFLGERGNFFNHRGLFPETLHVPLFLHLPGQTEGQHVADRVTNRDIVPTILSALGLIESPGHRDLVAVARAGADPDRRLWFEHANGLAVGCRDARYHFIKVLKDGFKFGVMKAPGPGEKWLAPKLEPAGSVFLYDWTVDPGLTHNLAGEQSELVERYEGLLEEYRASARPVGREARLVGADEAAELEALGYTGD